MACGCGTCATCSAAATGPVPGVMTRPHPVRLAQRLAPIADRMRARVARYGLRPYEVFLVWTRWTGEERGEGNELLFRTVKIEPTPLVEDLTGVSLSAMSAGILPVGSVRVSQITTMLTSDNLTGKMVPGQTYFDGCRSRMTAPSLPPATLGASPQDEIGHALARTADSIVEPYEFFYEIVEDVPGAQRSKFRPFAEPFRRAGKFDWAILLQRESEDRDREGHSRSG